MGPTTIELWFDLALMQLSVFFSSLHLSGLVSFFQRFFQNGFWSFSSKQNLHIFEGVIGEAWSSLLLLRFLRWFLPLLRVVILLWNSPCSRFIPFIPPTPHTQLSSFVSLAATSFYLAIYFYLPLRFDGVAHLPSNRMTNQGKFLWSFPIFRDQLWPRPSVYVTGFGHLNDGFCSWVMMGWVQVGLPCPVLPPHGQEHWCPAALF